MALWTSTSTRNLEVDLVSFDGTTAIFRINGTPKMRDVERLLREAYEHGLCTAEEYRDYYRKRMAPGMIQRDPSPRPMTFEPAKPKKKDRTLLKSIVLLFLLLLPNGLFFWSLLFKMLGSGI